MNRGIEIKSNATRILTVVVMLCTTICTDLVGQNSDGAKSKYERKGNYDWKKNMVIAEPKHDAVDSQLCHLLPSTG